MNIWKFIASELAKNCKISILIVIDSKGSSPGRKGFKMAVSESGNMYGSIGGGLMEYNMAELAKEKLNLSDESPFIKRQVHNSADEEDTSGMICSGEQTIAFYFLGRKEQIFINEIIYRFNKKEFAGLLLSHETFKIIDTTIEQANYTKIKSKTNWEYFENLFNSDQIYIVGAGHVGLALSQIMLLLDFHVSIFDNRPDLNTLEQNIFAHEKKIINYNSITDYIPEGNNIYVVIMTFEHRSDQLILEELLFKDIRYLGLMASKSKANKLLKGLENKEINTEIIEKVYTPIGLKIHSKTPVEIAISIAAEIIQVKNSY